MYNMHVKLTACCYSSKF